MLLRLKGYLWDMLQAVQVLQVYTEGRSLSEFLDNQMLRDAVEREFQILGQALVRLKRFDSETADRISNQEEIIGFRNVLVHEYNRIDPEQVWRTIQNDLPGLRVELETMLEEPDDDPA